MKIMIVPHRGAGATEDRLAERKAVMECLGAKGHTVVEPHIRDMPPSDTIREMHYLGSLIQAMANCDAVCLLSGWEDDKSFYLICDAAKIHNITAWFIHFDNDGTWNIFNYIKPLVYIPVR